MYLNLDVEALVDVSDAAEEQISNVIKDLENIKEYEEVKLILEDALDQLKEISESFKEEYSRKCQEEEYFLNQEYERSKF